MFAKCHVISKVSFPARRTADPATDCVQSSEVEDEVLFVLKAFAAKLTREHLQADRKTPLKK